MLRGDAGALEGDLLRPVAVAVEARLLDCAEQHEEATATLDRGLRIYPGDPVLLVARARLELAARDPDLAAATLAGALPRTQSRALRIEALVLAAVAGRARHDMPFALAALDEALALAEPEAIRQPFVDCGPAVRELLADLLRSGSSHRWLAGS